MRENLAEVLVTIAQFLHYLNKYTESNTLILLSRLLRAKKIETLEDLEKHVTEEENRT